MENSIWIIKIHQPTTVSKNPTLIVNSLIICNIHWISTTELHSIQIIINHIIWCWQSIQNSSSWNMLRLSIFWGWVWITSILVESIVVYRRRVKSQLWKRDIVLLVDATPHNLQFIDFKISASFFLLKVSIFILSMPQSETREWLAETNKL